MAELICISAPSGTGKSTVINELLKKDPGLALSISATTRAPRGSERDGVEYFFLDRDTFRAKIEAGEFLEYEEVHGEYYGTLRSTVENFLRQGKRVVFDIDVNGALEIKKQYGERAVLIFLEPPSLEELKRRLVNRKTESEEKIALRLKRLPYELEKKKYFDYTIVNDILEETVEKIRKIIS
jgi:guanylate kinase